MIIFWNKAEVYLGYSVKDFSKVRDILTSNGIEYSCKVTTKGGSAFLDFNRARLSSLGDKSELSYEYHIYVHKKDYDSARYLINKSLH